MRQFRALRGYLPGQDLCPVRIFIAAIVGAIRRDRVAARQARRLPPDWPTRTDPSTIGTRWIGPFVPPTGSSLTVLSQSA